MQPFVRWEDLEFEANGLKYTGWRGKQLDIQLMKELSIAGHL